jgi:hypothetical protein
MTRKHVSRVILVVLAIASLSTDSKALSSNCVATVLNRSVRISEDGTFALPNAPIPPGPFRARVICEFEGETVHGGGSFVLGVPNGSTPLGAIDIFFTAAPTLPVTLSLSTSTTSLSPETPSAQLSVAALLANGSTEDFSAADTGTSYQTSNLAVASVSANGIVAAVGSGVAAITVINQGVMAAIQFEVQLAGDRDGDGLPDDFEDTNALNPGGANRARDVGVFVNASSSFAELPPAQAIDGSRQTLWQAASGDGAGGRLFSMGGREVPSGASCRNRISFF